MAGNQRLWWGLALAGTLGLIGWLVLDARVADPGEYSTPDGTAAVAPDAEAGAAGAQSGGSLPASDDRVGLDTLEQDLEAWRELYGPVGRLSQAETVALVARRDAAEADLVAQIAALPPARLSELAAWHRASDSTRDRLLIVHGLGGHPSTEAVALLEEIYASDAGFTNRSHVLDSLRRSTAPGRIALLVDQMWHAPDQRLQQLAAQGLWGETTAAGELARASSSGLPIDVRLEAIHSLGATHTAVAQSALVALSTDDSVEPRVRVFAAKELERSFG